MTHLFPKFGPLQCDDTAQHCVGDKLGVVHELVGGEGGDCVQKQGGSLLELPDGHAVDPTIHLETVPSVPVSPLIYQTASTPVNQSTWTPNGQQHADQPVNNTHAKQCTFNNMQTK